MNVKRILFFVLAVAMLLSTFCFSSCDGKKKPEYTYEEALAFLDSGDTATAIDALRQLKGHKNADQKRKELYISLFGEEIYNKIHSAEIGDVITYGNYEQDDNYDNGSEEIEWIVIDKDGDGNLLLLTKYAIDCVRYHKKKVDITWEECFTREWLNDSFIKAAFTEQEQMVIPVTYVENKDNPKYGTDGGNDTEDKVFLLSIEEAQNLFEKDSDRKTQGTKVAQLHYAYCDPFGNTAWWLRSPSFDNTKAALVTDTGEVYIGAYHEVTEIYIATRPAMWLDLA